MSETQAPSRTRPNIAFEEKDVSPKLLAALAAALLGVIAILLVALRVAFPLTAHEHIVQPNGPVPPVPRLQSNPPADLATLRRTETDRLTSYGWSDRTAGMAHMPIDDAMWQTAERGLPERPKAAR